MFVSNRKNHDHDNSDEYLEQVKRDFAEQVQSLQQVFQQNMQNIQYLQRKFAEEIHQLSHAEDTL